MNKIEALNQQIDVNAQEVESMIDELVEREECACTAHGCGGQACGIN